MEPSLSVSWSHALLSHRGQHGCHTLAFHSPDHPPFGHILLKGLLNSGAEKGVLCSTCSLIDMPRWNCGRLNNDPEKDISNPQNLRMLPYMAKESCGCDLNVITRIFIRERQRVRANSKRCDDRNKRLELFVEGVMSQGVQMVSRS